MAYQVQMLKRFIVANPALSNVPFGMIHGRSITPRQALVMLQRGEAVAEVVAAMEAVGLDPPQDWDLAEDYYRRLLQLPGPHPKIYAIGQEMTLNEALMHIKRRDAKGSELLSSYQSLRREMARRMR